MLVPPMGFRPSEVFPSRQPTEPLDPICPSCPSSLTGPSLHVPGATEVTRDRLERACSTRSSHTPKRLRTRACTELTHAEAHAHRTRTRSNGSCFTTRRTPSRRSGSSPQRYVLRGAPPPRQCHSQSRQHSHSRATVGTDAEAAEHDNPGAASTVTNTPKRARERLPHRPTERSRRNDCSMRTSPTPKRRNA